MIKIEETQNNELGVLLDNYKKLEQENARLCVRVLKLEGLILYTDDALSSEECGSDIQLRQWSEYVKCFPE